MECVRPHISTPASAAALFRAVMPKEQREARVFVLPLDAQGSALAKPILVSVGHEDGTTAIDAGAIFREALKVGAEEIIVAHNHPSGNLTPSRVGIAATARLQGGAELVGLKLIDHLIIGNGERFCSLAEMQLC